MYVGGSELKEVHDNATKLRIENPPYERKEYSHAIARLDSHFGGSTNINVRIGKFRALKQLDDENFSIFNQNERSCKQVSIR